MQEKGEGHISFCEFSMKIKLISKIHDFILLNFKQTIIDILCSIKEIIGIAFNNFWNQDNYKWMEYLITY